MQPSFNAVIKTWKTEGVIEVPRPVLELTGDLEAAAMLYYIIRGLSSGAGTFVIGDKEFAAALGMGYEPFRYLRRKLQGEGLINWQVRQLAGGITAPHYSADLVAIEREAERIKAGGVPKFVRGRHKPQNSHSQQNKRLPENSQSQQSKGVSQIPQTEVQFSHSQQNKALSENPQTPPVFPQYNPSGDEDKTPATIWVEVMGLPLGEEAAAIINRKVTNRVIWRETLVAWKSNPKWNNANWDGQISRYEKKKREGEEFNAPAPSVPKIETVDPARASYRSQIYGDPE